MTSTSDQDPAVVAAPSWDVTYGSRPASPIDSVDHVLKLLLRLRQAEGVRVGEVARDLGVAQSTAHRLLAMLAYRGYVVRDADTPTYRPGTGLVHVGLAALNGIDIRRQARPYLERLAVETSETVSLVVLEGPSVRFVEGIESTNMVRVGSRTGSLMPAHATAGGKTILAALPESVVDRLFPDEELPPLTATTIRTKSELLSELDRVRMQGFAINSNESQDGVTAIGAPIRDHQGYPLAALNIAAPASRVSVESAMRLASQLCGAIDELEAALDV